MTLAPIFKSFKKLKKTAHRGVINDKAGKAAALPKLSDSLTLSQSGKADYAHPKGNKDIG